MRLLTVFLSSLLTAGLPLAAAENASDLLHQVAATYKGMKSLEVTARVQSETKDPQHHDRLDAAMRYEWEAPDKVRIEFMHPVLGKLTVSDGKTLFTYLPKQRAYYEREGAAARAGFFLPSYAGKATESLQYSQIDQSVESAKVLRHESLTANSRGIDCVVVQATYRPLVASDKPAVVTFWIDPGAHLVIKQASAYTAAGDASSGTAQVSEQVQATTIRANAPLPASDFAFQQPPGAREVKSPTEIRAVAAPPPVPAAPAKAPAVPSGTSIAAGQPLPDISLTDSDGKTRRLDELKGHPAVLVFVSTSSPESRHQLPALQALQDREKSKGINLWAIAVGESPAQLQSYRRQHQLTVPLLTISSDQARQYLGITTIPSTILVDKQGKIAQIETGPKLRAELEEAVQTAKLDTGAAPAPKPLGMTPPVVLMRQFPSYTDEARRAHLEGHVRLAMTIGAKGNVTDVSVLQPLGLGLDEKAADAAMGWKFEPATRNGKPVRMGAKVEMDFKLTDPCSNCIPPAAVLFPATEGVTRPVLETAAVAMYPPSSDLGCTGDSVIVDFDVDAQGNAQNVHMERPYRPNLDELLMNAVRQWRFKPATRDGQTIATRGRARFIVP